GPALLRPDSGRTLGNFRGIESHAQPGGARALPRDAGRLPRIPQLREPQAMILLADGRRPTERYTYTKLSAYVTTAPGRYSPCSGRTAWPRPPRPRFSRGPYPFLTFTRLVRTSS